MHGQLQVVEHGLHEINRVLVDLDPAEGRFPTPDLECHALLEHAIPGIEVERRDRLRESLECSAQDQEIPCDDIRFTNLHMGPDLLDGTTNIKGRRPAAGEGAPWSG